MSFPILNDYSISFPPKLQRRRNPSNPPIFRMNLSIEAAPSQPPEVANCQRNWDFPPSPLLPGG